MEFERTSQKKFNAVLMIACLVGALAGWFIAEFVYNRFLTGLPNIIQVGVYFAIIFFAVAIAAFISELAATRVKSMWVGKEIARSVLFIILGTVIFFLTAMLFQFIYGLSYTKKHTVSTIDDYIFIVDNSSSTDQTDPSDMRFSEIEKLVASLDDSNKIMVEIFDHEIQGRFPLTEANDGTKKELTDFFNQIRLLDKGGTEIQEVLIDAINEYTDNGSNAAAIFLSDGESGSSVDYKLISDEYMKKEVPIYAVAFSNMSHSGKNTMTQLADRTEGYYYEIGDINELSGTLNSVVKLISRRNLLERRTGKDLQKIIPLILRILFIFLLGVLLQIGLTFVLDYEDLIKVSLLKHLPFALLAGIFMEFLLRICSVFGVRLLMALLMSVVLCSYMKVSVLGLNGDVFSYDSGWDEPGLRERKEKKAGKVGHFDHKDNLFM